MNEAGDFTNTQHRERNDILSSRYKLEKLEKFTKCSALKQVESRAFKTRVPKFETRIIEPYPPKMHCVEAYNGTPSRISYFYE